MNSRICLLILKNKAKLNKLIDENASYDKILHQSQILDKYLAQQHIFLTKKKRN